MSIFRGSNLVAAGALAWGVLASIPEAVAQRSLTPNEPPGYQPFASYDGSVLLGEGALSGGAGEWYAFPKRSERLTLGQDSGAPASPPCVVRTIFPAGLRGGRGPVHFGGWEKLDGPAAEKSKVYLSLWIKIEGNSFENHGVGTKMGFIAYGRPTGGSRNQGTFMLSGRNARPTVADRWLVQFNQQFPVNRNIRQNVGRRPLMTVGVWHQWEAVFELNRLGQDDGVLRFWIDGQLVMDYRNVRYIVPGDTVGFNLWIWNPTWGGMGGVRSRIDVIVIDHVYLSGVRYEPR